MVAEEVAQGALAREKGGDRDGKVCGGVLANLNNLFDLTLHPILVAQVLPEPQHDFVNKQDDSLKTK